MGFHKSGVLLIGWKTFDVACLVEIYSTSMGRRFSSEFIQFHGA